MGAAGSVPDLARLLPARRPRGTRLRARVAAGMSLVLAMTLADFSIPSPVTAAPATTPPASRQMPEPCPDSRPDRTSALVAARMCGGRVLVESATTETTQLWANADGTMSAEASSGVVRLADGAGGWRDVDLNLVRRPDGSVAPPVHPGGLVLAGGAKSEGEHELARLGSGEEQIALGWRGRLPVPVLEGPKATYRDVRPGVDLVVETTRYGFRTFVVVKNRAAAEHVRSVDLPWRTGGLVDQAGGRGFAVRDQRGVVKARVSDAYMWDARVNPASGEPQRRVPVGLSAVDRGGGKRDLVLTPDEAFLADPSTVYPVVIDPYWEIEAVWSTHDTWVQNTGGTGWHDVELKLGTWNGGGEIARSFIMFDLAPFFGTKILDADLHLYETWAFSCRDAEWQLWVTDYTDHTTTWSSQQNIWYVNTESSWQTTGYDSCEPDGWVSIDATDYFQIAADGYYGYYNVGLRAGNEFHSDSWKRFRSSNSSYNPPYVSITFSYPPTVGSLATVPATSGCVTGSGRPWMTSRTPRLSAVPSEPDGQSSTVTFEYGPVGGTMSTGTSMSVPSGTVAYFDVPSGSPLTEGGTYQWRARAVDASNQASAWSSWCEFTVDTRAPGVPFVSSPEYPENGRGTATSGQFTFSPANGDTDVVAYTYQMDTETSANTVNVTTPPTVVTITPSAEGSRTLTVRAKDRAGNLSAPKEYRFDVGRAGIAQPLPGATVTTRAKIALDVVDTSLTSVRFKYRRGPGGGEADIPVAHLRRADGSPFSSSQIALSAMGDFAIWNAVDTLGSAGGVVQIKAELYPVSGAAYHTAWVSMTVDPDGDTAAAAQVGPGSVNLLTGDYTLPSTDVDDLGLSVTRVASSREPGDGWLPQGERLTVNQRQVGTNTAGFGGVNVSIARSTTHGQGSSTDSLEVTSSGTSSDAYATFGCDHALCNGMQPGKRYRLTTWIYVPLATGLTGGFPDRALRLVGFYYDGGAYHQFQSSPAAWTGAWQELTLDLAVPATATQAFFRLYNGMPTAGKKVYFDNLSLRELVAPFGPSWRGGVADAAAGSEFTYLDFPDPDVVTLHTATGGEISFARTGSSGAFFPQPGAESLTLTYTASGDHYDLTDIDGTVVRFSKPAGGARYMVSSTWTTEAASMTTYVYDTTDNRTLVTRVASPAEPGVTGCTVPVGQTPGRGCEVLEYVYATSTTATPSALGNVKDQVSAVKLWTWDPTANGGSGAQTAVEVVNYRYDHLGRLREVWDPRVSPALKTTYEYDSAGRVTKATPPGELAWMFDYGTIPADTGNAGRLHRVRRPALQQGSPTVTDGEIATRIVYQVPLTRSAGGPHDMDHAAISTWGQADLPTDATAIFGPEDDPTVVQANATTPGADGYRYATVHYLNASAQEINTATPHPAGIPGASIDSVQYDRFGNVVWELQATNRLIALGQHPDADTILEDLNLDGPTLNSAARAQALSTVHQYSLDGQDLLETLGPTIRFKLDRAVADPDGTGPLPALAAGDTVVGRAHTVNVYDEGKPEGTNYHLVTTSTTGAKLQTAGYPDVDTRTTKTGYDPELGGHSGWALRKPTKIITDFGGQNLTAYIAYDSSGRPTESRGIGSNGADARTTQTIYYTAGANTADPACGNVPEWAGQPCVTRKAGPVTGHDPARMATNLPVRRVTAYSRYGDVRIVTETVPGTSATRTTTTGYDTAGRITSVTITSTDGTPVSTVTTGYSTTTGHVTTTQLASGGGTITREYDLLGRLFRYTDADGGVTTNEFDRYGKPTKVTDPTGHATFAYDRTAEPRGFLTSVTDSIAGTFTAEYSPDGQLTTLHYPGGVTRTDTLDTNLEPEARTYRRDSDQAVIYTETITSNSAGETVEHTYTGGQRTYQYDAIGRLTTVQDVIDGAGCTTRSYEYDSRTNRTARKTWNPGAGGECRNATHGTPDAATSHSVDTADRLTDAGYTYDPFGRVTTLPGGLSNTYYANDLIATQTLGDTRQSWTLDPAHRFRAFTTESFVGGNWVNATSKLNHYGDDSDEPRWIVEDTTLGTVTRMVSGPDGDLAATTSATGDVELQIVNLHGDVVTTIDNSGYPTAFRQYDEFGVPATGQTGHRYGWLGGKQRSAEALGDVILMGVRLYHPHTGRFLQPDPVDGGSATAYDYCNADPINCLDLDGRWGWLKKAANVVKKAAAVVAPIAAVASIIPGPIGTAAAAVSAVAYAATGNWKQAAIMTATAAAAFVGAGAVGVAAVAAVRVASKVATKAPQLLRAATSAGRGLGTAARSALSGLGRLATRAATAVKQCLRNSFDGDTLVLMADGTRRRISEVSVGDYVAAADPVTGEVFARPVLEVIVGHGEKHLIEIDLDGDAATTLTATAEHPVWVVGKQWTDAEDIRPGDHVQSAGGAKLAVRQVVDRGLVLSQTVYNLNVGDLHTYFVWTDGADILVHNRSICGYTQHALDRMAQKNISREMVENTVRTGRFTRGNKPGFVKYVGRNIWVVMKGCTVWTCGRNASRR